MDEYRPYPADQPDDSDEKEETTSEGETERPAPPYRSEPRMSSSEDDDDDDETDEDEADDVDEGEEGDEERPARAGGRRGDRGDRGERATPNLDHPGGHLTGTVARLNRPRRFGFLRTDDGMEIFFHASALESGPSSFDQLRSGQAVEFDCHQDEAGRGLAASLVQVVGPPPAEAPRQQRQ
ncbi:MAG TPA: cold shock domain-containing protein, partial [Chloroflexota bacterium]|nr:cold shock domain-containing protein [Chloroflexota bacterium]